MTRREFEDLLDDGLDEELLEAALEFVPDLVPHPETGYLVGDPLVTVVEADLEILEHGLHGFYVRGRYDPHRLACLFGEMDFRELAGLIRITNRLFPDSLPPYRGRRPESELRNEMADLKLFPETFRDHERIYGWLSDDLPRYFAEYIRDHQHRYGPK